MDVSFFDSLSEGDSPNGAKLGMGLTGGDFWARIVGCQMLYRGPSIEEVDFSSILAVAEAEASEIQPPSYVPHNSSSNYFYVIRRANHCGFQEHTLAAAVKVSIDANGDLMEPQPNNIFVVRAKQVEGDKVQLIWYYCPIGQESTPARFKIYCDGGTGQIDYENFIAVICYTGRRFYSYQSATLEAGRHLFAVRVEDAAGVENASLASIAVRLNTISPDAIKILGAKAV